MESLPFRYRAKFGSHFCPCFLSLIFVASFHIPMILLKVYSIVNEEANAEECKAKIKAYEEAHRTEIVIRQSQRADEERAIQDRIAAEQRESERLKREYEEDEKAIALKKLQFKKESTEVLLGVCSYHANVCIIYLFLF